MISLPKFKKIWGKGKSDQVWVYSLWFMIYRRMMIHAVISLIFRPWRPILPELFLWFPLSEPPQFHIRWFGSFVDHFFVSESHWCWVVCLDWRLRLWPTHFNECIAQWYPGVSNHSITWLPIPFCTITWFLFSGIVWNIQTITVPLGITIFDAE